MSNYTKIKYVFFTTAIMIYFGICGKNIEHATLL